MNRLNIKYDAPIPAGWFKLGRNSILDKMLNKINIIESNIFVFLNFSNENILLSQFSNNYKFVSIAICIDKNEYDILDLCWNKYHENYDGIILLDFENNNWRDIFFEKVNSIILNKYHINMKTNFSIIMNPPYDGNKNLYGKITLECTKHADEVVCLSPYLNYLNNSQKKNNHVIAAELMPKLNSYELVSSTFDAAFDKELCIFHFSKNNNNNIDINDIYWKKFTNPPLTKSILKKCESYKNHCYDKIITKRDFDNYKFKVAFSGIRGNTNHSTGEKCWDWTTLLDEDKMTNFTLSSTNKGDLMGFPFKTENECKNFVKYVNQDIFEFLIFVQKNSMNTDKWLFKIIPYLLTYTKDWSEKEIAIEIGLTKDELDYIHQEMKNFGWKTRK